MAAYNTLTDLIISRESVEDKGITFILGDTEEVYISYKELYHKAQNLLYEFQKTGFKKGDEVIFQIDDNQRFVCSFWACILGGMIPVPVSTGTIDEHKLKMFKIWEILDNPRIITTSDFLDKLRLYAVKNKLNEVMKVIEARTVFVDDVIQTDNYGKVYMPQPEDIAFIQFSSGSTGDPKGVMIKHSNVLINLNSVIQWARISSNDSGLNWMPLTHDMGLIGTHVKGVIACINQYNIHTSLFVRRPMLWIKKASEHKVTLLYSPNFGYKHFLKFYKPKAKKEWDLSNVRLIYNGAEPISLELCNGFLDKMSEYGLRRSAMHPVYGLAEGTIAVTFPKPGEEFIFHSLNRSHLKLGETVVDIPLEDKNAITFMDVGFPIYNCNVRICDEENNDLGEDKIGYIQIRGGSVTSGYYNNQVATEQVISGDGWLNTGDLGFTRNKRLTVTGRAKDVIFMAGQNYYSHDIERISEDVEGIELGKIAAVGVFNEKVKSDELILFVMFKQKTEKFIDTVLSLKRIIHQKIGVEVSEVIPVKSIPKTTSGKIQRFKLSESYLKGEYDLIIHEMRILMTEAYDKREVALPTNIFEEELINIWSEVLNIKPIDIHDNFFELGGDSLKITQLISRIRDIFDINLDQVVIFDNPEVKKLAFIIQKSLQNSTIMHDRIAPVYKGDTGMPLSFSQQRLWFIDRLNGNSPQYNLCTTLLFKGRLDRVVLERSLNKLIKRHKVLQMSFCEEDGQPVQVCNPSAEFTIDYMDLENISDKEREKQALRLARDEARNPFDIGKAPLIRGKLFRLQENEHILVLVVHHIVFDGWSFGILLKELNFFYEAFLYNKEKHLPQLDIQYMDFVNWQTKKIQDGFMKKQMEAYWKKQLSGELPVLDIPLDKPRPPVQKYNGVKFVTTISREVVEELKIYSRRENATLFMVLLAAFKTLLYRYSGQSDIMVGTPIANRNRKETEQLIGLFTNNIVLRSIIPEGINFSEFLRQVKKVTLEAYSNQDVTFEKLVEELRVERDMSRNPLFQILFGLQNTPLPKLEFSEVNVSIIGVDTGYAKFDISVDVHGSGEELDVEFEYNSDLFNNDTIIRMAGHYKQLLKSILKNPHEMLDKYEILTKEEKNILLYKWNETEEDFGEIKSWIELFERQAEKSPDKIAVICGNRSISYHELNDKSNKLAQYLVLNGAKPESIIGVYMSRSVEMLLCLLAIHKAGAAYLPLDPIFPSERLEYMIEDAKAAIILSEKKLVESLPVKYARIICVDDEWNKISVLNVVKSLKRSKCDNLAYLIYTSGSTGKPKGVQVDQHALTNFLLSMANKVGMDEKDVLLAVTTLSFDIAGLELYMPLICGATTVIAEQDDVTDGERLSEMLSKQSITMMQATPATWKLLIESGWSGCKSLKVLCGGETLSRNLANQLLDRCSILYNVYGPTETTIWSTLTRIQSNNKEISIGKPIANTSVYVVDKSMNLVPIGIRGELLIGGDGLARGYLNLSELTKEKFIIDSFSKKEGAYLYKTGDLVRYLSDGNLEFIGRMDKQVKIRGFRIEPGEIESLINQILSVKECVVVSKKIISDENSLVAYIIPMSVEDRKILSTEYFRKRLKNKLPNYMIPSAFILMNSYPMTPNGKVDKNALPMPDMYRPDLETSYSSPSTEIERKIASIWGETLNIDNIGIDDNFFDLGGHSLLLAQVRSKIEKVLKKEVTMMNLFKYPTVSTLSKYLAGEIETKSVAEINTKNVYRTRGKDVAVIGLSGRFPGAKNIDEFWLNLCDGIESISYFTDEQVVEEGVDIEILNKPGYVKAWGALDDIDKFDAQFFGYNPREAEVLDPQQRVFLEESWKALENAGYHSDKYKGVIGVYASVGMNTYAQNLKEGHRSKGLADDYQIMISNEKDFLTTRVAYKMNLKGPCMTVQTACSSSLVAVHLACQSLINRECDIALAGGVSIRLPQRSGYFYQEGMILSPDGHCRAFDKQAKGTVGGNGAGVVALKRLEDAIADGDDISAVIKGTAINNDGAVKMGYTSPSIDGQAQAVWEAQFNAGIDTETITYVETHGTGTPLGDPIEIEALTQVFNRTTKKRGFCTIGSVKTNIGHLDAAAGITGFIKTVLSLRNRKIPPSLNFESPNPKINFEESPFFVNTTLTEWKSDSGHLRAGVSSFGIGGTNVHVVLEEAPALSNSGKNNSLPCMLTFSAKNNKALDRMTADFIDYLKANREVNLLDVAYTLHMGRKDFDCRRFIICTSVQDVLEALENINTKPKLSFSQLEERISIQSQSVVDNVEQYSLKQLGSMWLEGARIDWNKLYKGQKRRRIALPAYPLKKQSFWIKRSNVAGIEVSTFKAAKSVDISDWFYTPIWKQSLEENYSNREGQNKREVILILMNENDFSNCFVRKLDDESTDVVIAVSGDKYNMVDKSSFKLDIDNRNHYYDLLSYIYETGRIPSKIINLLGITGTNNSLTSKKILDCGKKLFYSMLYLAQAIGKQSITDPIDIKVITDNAQRIFNEQAIFPEKALHLGACRVIPREYPNIRCFTTDIVLPEKGSSEEIGIIEKLINDVYKQSTETVVAYRGLERWKQEFEILKLSERKDWAIRIKNKGVYLITGGLGGIGLIIAEYLAREMQVKLVLAGRSEFPDKQQWDEWITTHGEKDSVSRKIAALKKCQALGAELSIYTVDISNFEQLKNLREKVEKRFGRVDGIIHAAGNAGGGMIQLRNRERAEKVLKPKVKGTLVLYETFKDCKPDFIILCSSLNAITGGFGQIDYSAANAFLDAFSHAHDNIKGTRIISIDWDRWPGVGMVSSMIPGAGMQREETHPLLGKCIRNNSEEVVYKSVLYPEKDWVLSEHLIMDTPTVAGTTYLEMARGAYEDITGKSQMQISDVIFLSPMTVRHNEKRDVYTIINKNGNKFDFRVISRLNTEEQPEVKWLEHVRGKIKPYNNSSSEIVDIQKKRGLCSTKTIFKPDRQQKLSEEFISFGQRWRALKEFSMSDNEGLVEVEMAKEFFIDLEDYKLHPALLDIATGALRLSVKGNYLPLSYKRIEIRKTFPSKILGCIKFKNEYDLSQEIITCDVDIVDESGEILVAISDFSMKLIGEAAAASIRSGMTTRAKQMEYPFIEELLKEGDSPNELGLNEGISPKEGQEIFARILKGCFRPQIIVSKKDIQIAMDQADYINRSDIKEAFNEVAATRQGHPRPQLDTEYVSPKNETEKKMSEIWQNTLSIDNVGIYDEFFALGGDSLLLIQLHTKLKEVFETDIAVVDLYKYNTIALLSKLFSKDSSMEEQPSFKEVNSRASKQLEIMKQKRQQIQRKRSDYK